MACHYKMLIVETYCYRILMSKAMECVQQLNEAITWIREKAVRNIDLTGINEDCTFIDKYNDVIYHGHLDELPARECTYIRGSYEATCGPNCPLKYMIKGIDFNDIPYIKPYIFDIDNKQQLIDLCDNLAIYDEKEACMYASYTEFAYAIRKRLTCENTINNDKIEFTTTHDDGIDVEYLNPFKDVTKMIKNGLIRTYFENLTLIPDDIFDSKIISISIINAEMDDEDKDTLVIYDYSVEIL